MQIFGILFFSMMLPLAASAAADTYPNKPVRWVVPFPAGGGTDLLARSIGHRLSENLGQQFVVDNRPGAGGNAGTEMVAKADPNGYSILLAYFGTIAVNPTLYQNLPFDPVNDFSPVTLLASIPLVLVVPPSMPARSVKELIAVARAKPGQLNFGSGGNGSAQHLAGEMFKVLTATNITHIPYKGAAPATTDLIGGQLQMMFTGALAIMPHVKSGKLRALAVTSAKRASGIPDLPTMIETGVPGYEVSSWNGVLAPAKTPRKIVMQLNSELLRALDDPALRERLSGQGLEIITTTPDEFGTFIRAELARWSRVVKQSGMSIE